MVLNRRVWGAVVVLGVLAACAPGPGRAPQVGSTATTTAAAQAAPASPVEVPDPALEQEFARLEAKHDARLGVHAVDTGSGRSVAYRADERFAYASTFKALAAAVVLDTTTPAQLDEVVRFTKADLLPNSPISRQWVATGMTWRELCDAAVRYSDNTAGNLLLRRVGGPAGLDAALVAIGDDVTSVDQYEPELNSAEPGNPRDTSTPRALAHDMRQFALGDALAEDDRAVFVDWLRRNTTGDNVIRAGVPAGWVVGDKTGSAYYGGRNDMAVVWPPGRASIVIAVLTSRAQPQAKRVDALVVDAARVVVRALG